MRGWHFKDTLVWCPVCNQWQPKRAGWFCWNWHRLPEKAAQQKMHPTPESLASSQAVINADKLSQSDSESKPTQARVI